MSVIEKLKEAVRSVVEAEQVNLYKEARLQDGRVVATEAEDFTQGAAVRVMSEDGEAAPLQAGTYPLEGGGELKIGEDSKVALMEEEDKKEDMTEEEEKKEEMAEHEEEKDEMSAVKAALVDKFQISEEVAEQIVEVVKDAMKPEEEMEEEKKEEEMEEEKKDKEEMSALTDLTHEMAVALEAINKRLAKLEDEPAAQPERVLPKQEFKKEETPNLTGVDRALNHINQFS